MHEKLRFFIRIECVIDIFATIDIIIAPRPLLTPPRPKGRRFRVWQWAAAPRQLPADFGRWFTFMRIHYVFERALSANVDNALAVH